MNSLTAALDGGGQLHAPAALPNRPNNKIEPVQQVHSSNSFEVWIDIALNVVYIQQENLKVKICKTVILPVVLYGCETWSLTLGEEYRLKVFENRVLRKMDHGENCIMMSFMTCILRQILLG
jgi:hypothetical protein